MIQIVGPDGTGKSTISALLADRLKGHYPVHSAYLRPGLLPLPGRLIGKPAPGLVTDPHGRKLQGHLKATLRLLYYAVDFLVGYVVVYVPVLRAGGLVIVERGWQDMIVDSKRYLMPSPRLAQAVARVIPKPDVVVVLDAPASVVVERKDELSVEEITRQLALWKESAQARKRVIQLNAKEKPDSLVEILLEEIARNPGLPFGKK